MNADTVYGLLDEMGKPELVKEHTHNSLVSMEEM